MLQRRGHDVVASVTSGEEALHVATGLVPYLLLADVCLAGDVHGIAVASAVHSRLGIPAIVMSGHCREHVSRFDAAVDRFQFLRKSFSSNELSAAICVAEEREEPVE